MSDKMSITKYHVRLEFITEPLGSQTTKDVASEFIAKKHEEIGGELPEDEARTLPEELERGTTVFHQENGVRLLFDYQIKGFIKSAGQTFNGLNDVKALKSKIEKFVFVEPRKIPMHVPEGGKVTYNERPLRAETAQGPRVALARSEQLPIGTWCEFDLKVFESQINEDILRSLFSYGEYQGLLQWRGGGWGRFTFTLQ